MHGAFILTTNNGSNAIWNNHGVVVSKIIKVYDIAVRKIMYITNLTSAENKKV